LNEFYRAYKNPGTLDFTGFPGFFRAERMGFEPESPENSTLSGITYILHYTTYGGAIVMNDF
jgi:hypothetical protein